MKNVYDLNRSVCVWYAVGREMDMRKGIPDGK